MNTVVLSLICVLACLPEGIPDDHIKDPTNKSSLEDVQLQAIESDESL